MVPIQCLGTQVHSSRVSIPDTHPSTPIKFPPSKDPEPKKWVYGKKLCTVNGDEESRPQKNTKLRGIPHHRGACKPPVDGTTLNKENLQASKLASKQATFSPPAEPRGGIDHAHVGLVPSKQWPTSLYLALCGVLKIPQKDPSAPSHIPPHQLCDTHYPVPLRTDSPSDCPSDLVVHPPKWWWE